LIHILINKIDGQIESHTDYQALAQELAQDLAELDRTVKTVLHPYEACYNRCNSDLDEEQADLHASNQHCLSCGLFRLP